MIADTINPKFPQLSSTAQALWFLYLIIKDHQTNQFYYSLETLKELSGHTKKTIIKANNELETMGIIETQKCYHKEMIYTVQERIKLFNKDDSFLIKVENLHFQTNQSVETTLSLESQSVETTPSKCRIYTPSNDLSNNNNTHSIDHTTYNNSKNYANKERERNWKYENWREHFEIAKKYIEQQYPFFFLNTLKGNISDEQMRMMSFIGKNYDPETEVIPKIAGKLKDPIKIIEWTYEQLSGNGKKPDSQTPYKDNFEDFIRRREEFEKMKGAKNED